MTTSRATTAKGEPYRERGQNMRYAWGMTQGGYRALTLGAIGGPYPHPPPAAHPTASANSVVLTRPSAAAGAHRSSVRSHTTPPAPRSGNARYRTQAYR